MIEALKQELTAAGIAIAPLRRRSVTEMILRRGRTEFERLSREIRLPMESVAASAVNSLGVGAAMTEFATLHLAIPPAFSPEIERLGGLATLIVSAFDAILDSGQSPPEIRLGALTQGSAARGPLKHRIFLRLVELYYRGLASLPEQHPGARSVIDRAIRRMYAAEIQSASGGDSRSIWWRKNVLPVVVMAAPGWLALPCWKGEGFTYHIRWLCRLGEFYGWVDDCVDLARDELLGQTNRVRGRLRSCAEAGLARQVARQGRRILKEWDGANRASPVRDTFAAIIWNWLESGVSGPAS